MVKWEYKAEVGGGGNCKEGRINTAILSCSSMWFIKQQCVKRRKGDSPEKFTLLSTAASLISGIWNLWHFHATTSVLPLVLHRISLQAASLKKRDLMSDQLPWKYSQKVLYTNSQCLFEKGIAFLPWFHWKRTGAQINQLPFLNSKYK